MKTISLLITLTISSLLSPIVSAEPRTVLAEIERMRPYTTGGYFVTVGTNAMTDGSTCTNTFTVDGDSAGSKAVIASLLTAYALGQEIQLEIPTGTSASCAFGHPIQSVFMAQ